MRIKPQLWSRLVGFWYNFNIRKKMTDNQEQDELRDADSKADDLLGLGIILGLVGW
tara:strand:- start:62 stop:229 length:168 start_codon:yes stop_codon:yes gene_type:complete